MISEEQKNKIWQVLSVFETGKIEGDYASVVVMNDGVKSSKQITFGKHQTTEQGNLKILIQMYINNGGEFADEFHSYIVKIGKTPLASNNAFINLLKKAGADPIMHSTQDEFFDKVYYKKAADFFTENGFTLPLSMLVIYDSYVHSGSIRPDIRSQFPEVPPSKGGDERTWITQYVNARHNWLKNHSKKILHNTVYRTNCFKQQIKNNNWDLSQSINANGIIIN